MPGEKQPTFSAWTIAVYKKTFWSCLLALASIFSIRGEKNPLLLSSPECENMKFVLA